MPYHIERLVRATPDQAAKMLNDLEIANQGLSEDEIIAAWYEAEEAEA